MAFGPIHDDPKIQARMDFCREHNILVTFPKIQRKIYEKALKIFNKKTDDHDLYISDDLHDMDGTLRPDYSALKYKTPNIDRSEFWDIFAVVESKEVVSNYMKNTFINLYLKKKNTNEAIVSIEHVAGILVNNNDEYIEVKLNKNDKVLTIKYTDIYFIDCDDI